MEVLIKKQNVILDSQILSSVMSCARLADFRFNHHLVSLYGKSKSLEMGSIVHVFLEEYYGSIIQGVKRTEAVSRGLEAAFKYSQSEEVTNTVLEDRQWAIETCEQYADFYKNDFWTPLEAEVVKGAVLYEDDEIRIMWKAKLDLTVDTNQGIYPADHKTSSQRRDTLSLNNQFIGQCILMGTQRVIINKIGFQKSLKANEKFERAMLSYTAERLLEWQSEILPFYSKMLLAYNDTGYYPPNFTHCENKYGFCTFKGVCESNPEMREEELRLNFRVGEPWNIASRKVEE